MAWCKVDGSFLVITKQGQRTKEVEDCGGNARNRGTVTPVISHEYEIIS